MTKLSSALLSCCLMAFAGASLAQGGTAMDDKGHGAMTMQKMDKPPMEKGAKEGGMMKPAAGQTGEMKPKDGGKAMTKTKPDGKMEQGAMQRMQ